MLIRLLACVCLLFLPGCEDNPNVEARVPCPDHQLEAVIVATTGETTTSSGYKVFVVVLGGKLDQHRQVASLDLPSRRGLNARWESNDKLIVEFPPARRRLYLTHRLELGGRTVQIELRERVDDATSSPAGEPPE